MSVYSVHAQLPDMHEWSLLITTEQQVRILPILVQNSQIKQL